jgi:hypothetical protein
VNARLPRLVLWAAAILFAAFGTLFVAAPHWGAATVDIELPTSTATTDFIATYGGFEIGFAVFLFACLRRDEHVRLGLLAAGCAVAGFAVTRAIAIVAFGDVKPILYAVVVFEAVCAAAAFWAARRAQGRVR